MKGFIKRMLDIITAFLVGGISLPFVLLISIIILITMGRPVLFRQERPGYKGKPFNMYKFRTMNNKTDTNGNLLKDNERLTRFGRFLRTTSLDELPELINVLKGEMSLVGPRPLAMEYLDRYNSEQARRHDVKPGITGLAQVNGRNHITWEEKFNLDVLYVDNWTVFLDLKIIFKTIIKVLIKDGVVPEGDSVLQDFMGSEEQKQIKNNKLSV